MDTQRTARRVLVLGGARSGKSSFAERMLAQSPDTRQVTYAAAAPRYAEDAEWAERIERHRRQRPGHWRTVETGEEPGRLAALLADADGPVLVDCLTLWLTAAMDGVDAWNEQAWADGTATAALAELTRELVAGFGAAREPAVVVSNELGYGLVPPDPGSRRFRDELGRLNQACAAVADEVYLVVAGLPLRIK